MNQLKEELERKINNKVINSFIDALDNVLENYSKNKSIIFVYHENLGREDVTSGNIQIIEGKNNYFNLLFGRRIFKSRLMASEEALLKLDNLKYNSKEGSLNEHLELAINELENKYLDKKSIKNNDLNYELKPSYS